MYTNEAWAEVRKMPRYEVSTVGRIRNKDTGRILKPFTQNRGYRQIVLSGDTGTWRPTVHRLVAEAFLGPSDLEVNHKDLDKGNNRIENLEYVTRSQNQAHAAENGAWREHNPDAAKLTADQVLAIRETHATGAKGYGKLALEYGVDKSNIAAIIRRRTWKHI
jgi:hypothetical protein